MSRVGGYLPAAVAREWFANIRTFIVSATGAVGKAEVVDGGYRRSTSSRAAHGKTATARA